MNQTDLFKSFLINTGFEKAQQLEAGQLEWMLGSRSLKCFVDWCVRSIGPENIITDEEIQDYLESKEILADVPESAFEDADDFSDISDTRIQEHEDELRRAELCVAKNELEEISCQLSNMHHEHRIMSLHLSELHNTSSTLSELASQLTSELHHVEQECHALGIQLPGLLSGIFQTVQQLADTLSVKPGLLERGSPLRLSLFRADLKQLFASVTATLDELTVYVNKQFYPPKPCLVVDEELRSKHMQLYSAWKFVGGRSKEQIDALSSELCMVQMGIKKARLAKIKNFAVHQGREMQLKLLRQYMKADAVQNIPLKDLQKKLEHLQEHLETLDEEALNLTDSITTLVAKNTEKRTALGTVNEYKASVERAEHSLRKTSVIINYLVHQHSCMMCVMSALKYELEVHRRIGSTIEELFHLLNEEWNAFIRRKDAMKSIPSGEHDCDDVLEFNETTRKLVAVLDDSSKGEPVCQGATFPALKTLISRMHAKKENTHESSSLVQMQMWEIIDQLERSVQSMETEIFGEFTEKLGKHALSPPADVMQLMVPLHSKVNIMKRTVKNLVKEVEKKEKSQKYSVREKETALFVKFYTDPAGFLKELEQPERNRV